MKLLRSLTLLTLVLCLALLAPPSRGARAGEAIIRCSLINLIATPEKYHGKKVSVIGYAVLEFEAHQLYLSEIDAQRRISNNGIWLSLDEKVTKLAMDNHEELNRHYVIVQGIFNMHVHGRGELYSGSLKQIERLEPWGKP